LHHTIVGKSPFARKSERRVLVQMGQLTGWAKLRADMARPAKALAS
jgi:hypothetical protein